MTSLEHRQERVRQGSRRKRDLAAVEGFSETAWVELHMPEIVGTERQGEAVVAAAREWAHRPRAERRPPTRDEVLARLGWT